MGNSAGVTARHIQDLAGNLEKLTASEAENIQEGANLLLTFGNIRNAVGANNDIFDQAVKMSVDLSRAMGTTASGEAIRLGKALNDPVRGVSALTRVGVSFTEQQKEQIRTLSESGDILGAQKIILAELQNQFGGSGQAYAATFAGQVELLNHELGALGEEATLVVMPALRELVEGLREVAPEIGAKMKAAIDSVNWKQLAQDILGVVTFLAENIETIVRVVAVLWTLNTAYNVIKITVGLTNAVLTLFTFALGGTEAAAKRTTGVLGGLRTALLLGGVTLAVGSVIDEYRRLKEVVSEANSEVSTFNKESLAVTGAAAKLNPINTLWQNITKSILGAITANRTFRNESGGVSQAVMDSEARRDAAMAARGAGFAGSLASIPGILPPNLTGGGSGSGSVSGGVTGLPAWTANAKKEAKVTAKEIKLISKGLSADVARSLVGTNTPIKTANAAIQRINKNGSKAIANLTRAFQNSAAGQQAAAAQASAAAEAASNAAAAAAQAAAEQAAREAAILAEKQRVYEAFAYSVTSTFGRIKDSILGAFSLPELGGSTDSIIRNMDKLLARVKSFSQNITKLSSMGLDPKLLQQVINAGPIAGAKLAANLVAGGAGGLATINRGFAEIGGLASEIGMTGTQAQFQTAQQQQIININIEGGLDSSAAIGKAVVDAVRAYERTSGAVWQGA
jgi:hypothetical protein